MLTQSHMFRARDNPIEIAFNASNRCASVAGCFNTFKVIASEITPGAESSIKRNSVASCRHAGGENLTRLFLTSGLLVNYEGLNIFSIGNLIKIARVLMR